MSELYTYNINNPSNEPKVSSPAFQADNNLEAHTSKDMKVKRPKIVANDLNIVLHNKKIFSDKEATKKMQAINTDIYEGAKKEKEKHEFNLKRYFTIFGIFALLAAAIAYFRKGK